MSDDTFTDAYGRPVTVQRNVDGFDLYTCNGFVLALPSPASDADALGTINAMPNLPPA